MALRINHNKELIMSNQNYTWYNGHGVLSETDLSSSYIPHCVDNQFSVTTSLSGVPNYIWIDELYKKPKQIFLTRYMLNVGQCYVT